MPLINSNSAGDRTQLIKTRTIYYNYLATKTQYENGQYGYPPRVIDGTGASLESSAFDDIRVGQINISPAEQAAIIAANALPVLYGSISFVPGASLTTGLATDFSMGTGDFTAECWAYTNAAIGGGWTNLLSFGSAAGKDIRLAAGGDFFSPNGGKIGFIIPNSNNTDDVRYRINLTMATNTWYHFALVKSGSTVRFYVNGVSRTCTDDSSGTAYAAGVPGTFNHSGDANGKSNLFINNSLFNESDFNGYITNVRLVKGSALYTSNFTVPTVGLSVVSGTALLLKCASAATYLNDSSNNRTLSASGAVSFSTEAPFS
jgi:hypothetical protein